ncbi:MAG: DUF1289 domain-containing protein [Rhodospirillales bacterium]|nr:DUF1289 domain-containing protein [Rhodospirillales bacterium]
MNRPRYVESPCISVCQLDEASGLCRGCWRTRDEIAAWGQADSDTRLAILEKLHERREQARGARRRENRRRAKRT